MMKSLLASLLIYPAVLVAAGSPNVLLICVDDLRPELGCYGVDYIQTPNIDKLAGASRLFQRHYVQAPTCGASRYALLMGRYGPSDNYALFDRSKRMTEMAVSEFPSLPNWFRAHGYQTVSVGKVSHHPGGLGGSDWNDAAVVEMPDSWDRSIMPCGPWEHPRGAMHGLAAGEIRQVASEMDVYQSHDGPDTAYPDGLITRTALDELGVLANGDKPFFLAVGLIKPHLPFGAPSRYFEPYRDHMLPPVPHPEKPEGTTTWHASGEFMRYNRWGRDPRTDPEFAMEVRRHYAACVSFADKQVGSLLSRLRDLNLDKNTIVVLWGDHGWHLGEHAIWGKHSLFEEALRSPLLIHSTSMIQPGESADAVVESIDLYPTLCDLAELPLPASLQGKSLVPQLRDPQIPGSVAISYTHAAVTVRTDQYRLILHRDGYRELYRHDSPDAETRNIAKDEPGLVLRLLRLLKERCPAQFADDVDRAIDQSVSGLTAADVPGRLATYSNSKRFSCPNPR